MRLRDQALNLNEDHQDFIASTLMAKDAASDLALHVRAAFHHAQR